MHESLRCLTSQAFYLSYHLVAAVFDFTALRPTVILRALTCLDKGLETGEFSRVLGVVGIISICMYQGDGDQLMNGPTAAVVLFFLFMCVKCLVLSLTPLLRYDTHTLTHIQTHTHTHTLSNLSVE